MQHAITYTMSSWYWYLLKRKIRHAKSRKFSICNKGLIRCLVGIRNVRACKKSTSLSSPHQEPRYLQGIRNIRHARGLGSCKKVGVMQEGKVGIILQD